MPSCSDDLKGADKALLAAQRAWIAYRDSQCELAGFEARGGSMEPMLVSGCLADLTRKRARRSCGNSSPEKRSEPAGRCTGAHCNAAAQA